MLFRSRAQEVLKQAETFLREVAEEGLFKTLEEGKFAGIKRSRTGGKGLDGVVEKDASYFNPFLDLMLGGETGGLD